MPKEQRSELIELDPLDGKKQWSLYLCNGHFRTSFFWHPRLVFLFLNASYCLMVSFIELANYSIYCNLSLFLQAKGTIQNQQTVPF